MTSAAVLVVVCISLIGIGGAAAQSGVETTNSGVLVFSARPDARDALGWQLLVGDLPSGRVRRLVRVDGTVSPSWSPDGSAVAYERANIPSGGGRCNSHACGQIWRVGANSKRPRRITSLHRRSESPDWSSTGRIAFIRWHPSPGCCTIETEIYTLERNGRDLRRLTFAAGEDTDPAWSPDGKHIAFSSDRSGNFELYVMKADGGDLRRLTTTPNVDEYGPAWSPDGARIAFWRRSGSDLIVVVNADGTSPRTLSGRGAATRNPAWSPDGFYIAYVKDTPDRGAIWVMRSDGTEKHELIDGPFEEPSELDWK